MAAVGTPLRTLQGWMGHRDYKTTEIYADFAPDPSQGAVEGRGFESHPRYAEAASRQAAFALNGAVASRSVGVAPSA